MKVRLAIVAVCLSLTGCTSHVVYRVDNGVCIERKRETFIGFPISDNDNPKKDSHCTNKMGSR